MGREGRGLIQVDFSLGFFLTLICLIAVAATSAYQIYGTGPPLFKNACLRAQGFNVI